MAERASGRTTGFRRTIAALAVGVAIVAVAALGGSPASSGGAPTTGPIRALHSSKVMDVFQGSNAPGAPVVQWNAHGGTNQAWRLIEFGPFGAWKMVLIQSVGSNLVLDVNAGSLANGAGLMQNTWSASVSQLWIAVPFGDTGYTVLVNAKSGKVADVSRASQDNGTPVVQWTWLGGINQLWTTPPVLPPPVIPTTTTVPASTTTTSAPTTTTTVAPTTTSSTPPTTEAS
jgi:hypothetical protein